MSRKHKNRQHSYSSPNINPKKEQKDDFDFRLWRNILILASLLVFLIIFPPFFKNQVLAGHDAGAHLSYLRIFTDALSQGQFPVRWIEWVTPGQNQPLFSYYQPFLYYLGSIPHFLGFDILNSLYLTVLSMWLFSGFIVFLFVKNITKSNLAGIVSSCLYIFAPYHILDVFVRAAYPESIALAFAPGMFWAIERFISTERKIYLPLLSFFTAATFISHPPTLLMFGVPLFLYLLFISTNKFKFGIDLKLSVKKLVYVFISFILAGGLSSFFAIPALLQQNLTKASTLNAGYLDFHNHFVCLTQLFWSGWGYGTSQAGCNDQLSFQLGIINWIVIFSVIGILAYYAYKKTSHRFNIDAIFWIIIAFFGMYMTLSFSLAFWEGTPYLPFLQFPWRFLSVAIFASSILSGIMFKYLKKESHKLILFIVFMIATPLLSYQYLQPAAFLDKGYFAQDSQNFYRGTAKGQGGTAEMGYFPQNMDVLPEPGKVPESEIALSSQKATGKIIKDTFTYKEFSINSSSPIQAELYIHFFPGWKFYINGSEVKPNTSNIYDFVFLDIPAGNSNVTASFTDTPLVSLSNLITLLSIILFVSSIFVFGGKELLEKSKRTTSEA